MNDDFDEDITLNVIHREIASNSATDILTTSKQKLDINFDLPTSDLLIACHALMAQREYDGIKTWPMFKDLTSKLENVAESINDLGGYFDKLDENLVYLRGINEQLGYLIEIIDRASAKPIDFWMYSDLAAIDKAKELDINILPEYSMADLRYKIHCALNGGN